MLEQNKRDHAAQHIGFVHHDQGHDQGHDHDLDHDIDHDLDHDLDHKKLSSFNYFRHSKSEPYLKNDNILILGFEFHSKSVSPHFGTS